MTARRWVTPAYCSGCYRNHPGACGCWCHQPAASAKAAAVNLLRTRTEENCHVYRDYADPSGRIWTADATAPSGALRPEPETKAEAALAFAGGAR
jgi:hypothetical protein